MYRNSIGISEVPGIFVERGSAVFSFYSDDIECLIQEANDVKA
jgi:hypothetical protein